MTTVGSYPEDFHAPECAMIVSIKRLMEEGMSQAEATSRSAHCD